MKSKQRRARTHLISTSSPHLPGCFFVKCAARFPKVYPEGAPRKPQQSGIWKTALNAAWRIFGMGSNHKIFIPKKIPEECGKNSRKRRDDIHPHFRVWRARGFDERRYPDVQEAAHDRDRVKRRHLAGFGLFFCGKCPVFIPDETVRRAAEE